MFENLPFIGVLILGLNVIISLIGFKNDAFFEKYSFQIDNKSSGSVFQTPFFRLFTCWYIAFIFNMVTFYFLSICSRVFGDTFFLFLYLFSKFNSR